MLEIIVIWRLVVHIGKSAARKGLKKLPYQIMAVIFWICGELLGTIFAQVVFGSKASFWISYAVALLGAIAGAGIAFLVMRFLPDQALAPVGDQSLIQQETPTGRKFGRSIWMPVLAIILALSCLCAGFGGAFVFQVRDLVQNVKANNPIVGTEIGSDGLITQSKTEIPSTANAIYFGFYFDIPQGGNMTVTFDWFIDGGKAYSFSKALKQGNTVVASDRKELGVSQFNKGHYEIKAHIGNMLLTSGSFTVK